MRDGAEISLIRNILTTRPRKISRKRNHYEARDEFIDNVESNGTAKSA